jgi:ATP-binding cassette subfamily B protein
MNRRIQAPRSLLFHYLSPLWLPATGMALLLLAEIALQLVNPQVIRYFIDTAQTSAARQILLGAAALFIGISLLQRGVSLGASYMAENVGWSATNALRKDLVLHCLRLDMPFHKQHTPGELIERLDGDVTALANFFSGFVVQVLANALLVLGILGLLFREDLRLGIGLSLYTGAVLAVLRGLQHLAVNRWAAARQASAEQYGFLEEYISGAEEIQTAGAQDYALHRLYQLMRAFLERSRAAFVVSNLAQNLTSILFAIGYAVGLSFGVYLYTHGQASLGTAYLIVYYIGMLSWPLQNIQQQWNDLQQATASIGRIQQLLALRPDVADQVLAVKTPARNAEQDRQDGTRMDRINDASPASQTRTAQDRQDGNRIGRVNSAMPARTAPVARGGLSVAFDRVSFAYDGNDQVLHEVSFSLAAGKVLGVLGRTGSGKTTLTRLLFRLYDPSGGAIRLNGVDLRQMPLGTLRARVGMVTQDVQLFKASVRDNLAFFDRSIDDDRISYALKELHLWDWVQARPQGLAAPLAAGGQGLSAGEAQLLAFARVFLKDPGLVILDEASSRLDPLTENLLERAVDRLFAGRTAILIAHRLQTVQRTDELLILEDGRVIEYGSRTHLADDPDSHYSRLLRAGLEQALV